MKGYGPNRLHATMAASARSTRLLTIIGGARAQVRQLRDAGRRIVRAIDPDDTCIEPRDT